MFKLKPVSQRSKATLSQAGIQSRRGKISLCRKIHVAASTYHEKRT
jgi:hypothetical protein